MTSPGFLFLVALMIVFGIALVIAAAMERRRAREIREGIREVVVKERGRRGPGRRPRS